MPFVDTTDALPSEIFTINTVKSFPPWLDTVETQRAIRVKSHGPSDFVCPGSRCRISLTLSENPGIAESHWDIDSGVTGLSSPFFKTKATYLPLCRIRSAISSPGLRDERPEPCGLASPMLMIAVTISRKSYRTARMKGFASGMTNHGGFFFSNATGGLCEM